MTVFPRSRVGHSTAEPLQPANADLAARVYQIGSTPEVYKATNLQENASGAAMRMENP